jgi:isocitrate/isopropylmalate dehydrogenase
MGGDGVGRDVVAATLEVIEAMGISLEIVQPPHGADVPGGFPEETRKICDSSDAVLFGAAERASIPVLMYLRLERQTFANIRPSTTLFGTKPEVDLVIVRELSEGMYPGREGQLADLYNRWPEYRDPLGRPLPNDGAFAIRVVTPHASRRVGRHAAELTKQRAERKGRPGKLWIVTKENVLRTTDGLFRKLVEEEAKAVGVATEHLYVDEAARRLASRAEQFDVIVTTNLFGDIISDVAAESVGGMPVAPSGSVAEDGFGYFEPVHGSAPDIVGKGIANPFGTMLSAAMALYHLGFDAESERLVNAVRGAFAAGTRPTDMGGSATTKEIVAAVRKAIDGGSK